MALINEGFDITQECERLRELGDQAIRTGRYDDAARYLSQGLEVAQQGEEPAIIDRAHCNLYALELDLGRVDEAIAQLSKILMRSQEPEVRRLAAYHLARAYDRRKDWSKGLFYARIAQKSALAVGRPDWIASGENQIGAMLLTSSYFEEAIQSFERALEILPQEPSVERAIIVDNLGYCHIVQGHYEEGFRALFESLRTLRAFHARKYEVEPLMSLSYAYLEIERPQRSLRHGMAALALAEELGDENSVKTSLFLLGESAKLVGNDLGATDYFRRLQETYYPDEIHLPDMLMVIDARGMVNLKA
jgi:tetratricopeptide (TPR) repeat protein